METGGFPPGKLASMTEVTRMQSEGTRAALANAQALFAKTTPAKGRPFSDDWQDWLPCRILYREGEGLSKTASDVKKQRAGSA